MVMKMFRRCLCLATALMLLLGSFSAGRARETDVIGEAAAQIERYLSGEEIDLKEVSASLAGAPEMGVYL